MYKMRIIVTLFFFALSLVVIESLENSSNRNTNIKHENYNITNLFTLAKPLSKALKKSNVGPLCRKHFNLYFQGLEKLELWALKMYDSTGKWPSGLLNGNVHQLGDYKQCIDIDETISNDPNDHIMGKYCQLIGTVESTDENSTLSKIMDLVHSHNLIRGTVYDNEFYVPSFSRLSWALCVPSSCSHDDIYEIASLIVRPYNLTSGLDIRIKQLAAPLMCSTKEDDTYFTPFSKYYFTAFIGIIILAIIGSRYDNIEPKSKLIKFLSAFSCTKNYKLLMYFKEPEDGLSCLHGFRSIFSFFIYVLHRGTFSLQLALANRTDLYDNFVGWPAMIGRAFINYTDSFIIISGLLTSYYSMKKLEQGKKLNIPSMYLKRYLKFGPFYVFSVLWIYAVSLKNGPHAMRFGQESVLNCRNKSIFKAILMIENVDGMGKMCYPPAHQLHSDWQMYLLSPFIIQLFWKFPKHQLKILISLISVLGIYRAYAFYAYRLTPIYYNGSTLKEFGLGSDYVYINPLHRMIPYIMGIYFGYFLNTSGKKIVITQTKKIIGSLLAVVCAWYAIFGMSEIAYDNYEYEPIKSSVYSIFQPITWTYAQCWLIFLCHQGHLRSLNAFLSWNYFVIFSRISYAFYIVQIAIIFHGFAAIPVPSYGIRPFDLNEIIFMLVASIFATTFFIMPVLQLAALYLEPGPKKPKTRITITEENGDIKIE